MAKGKIIGGIIVGLVVIGGCNAAMNGSDSGGTKTSTDRAKPAASDAAQDGNKEADSAAVEDTKTQAEEFTDCVNENGTPTEKDAVKHVTKVTGTDKQNDILDSAEVYTDFTGGLMGPSTGDGKLIATAFTSCYESENGLVTVYGEDGDMLANAQF
ncbi:hypothetical protein ABZX40_13525 [Streptomyces sp. NPDC004610]|uniref:hypothetical protein n=1 Tax=unclassified Streptomyces TaxID=2593676 RepID=UPI0033B46480